MHCAPSVEYPVGRSVLDTSVTLAAALVWLLVQALWAWTWGVWPLPGAWWGATAVGVALLVLGRWQQRHPVQGRLCWQAASTLPPDVPRGAVAPLRGNWIWYSVIYRYGTPVERLECVLDAQHVLLLRLHNEAGLRTLVWLQRDADPTHWPALRRALQAHRSR